MGQPVRVLLGHVVEKIIVVMVMIPVTGALLRHGPQEVVVAIIMAAMVNTVVDMVHPQARLVELLHGSDIMKCPPLLQAVKDMDMEDIRVADMVIIWVDILLHKVWELLQGLVAVRAALVHHLDLEPCSRIMVPTGLGLHPHHPLEMPLLHLRATSLLPHRLGFRIW